MIYLTGFLVVAFSIYCVIIGIVIGIEKNFAHVILAIVLILIVLLFALTWKWYRDGTIPDPKVKLLIFIFIATTILCGISLNIYAFEKKKPCPVVINCPETSPLYNFQTKQCYSYCPEGMCRSWNGTYFGFCINCTQGNNTRVRELFNKATIISKMEDEIDEQENPVLSLEQTTQDVEEEKNENTKQEPEPENNTQDEQHNFKQNEEEDEESEENVALRNGVPPEIGRASCRERV